MVVRKAFQQAIRSIAKHKAVFLLVLILQLVYFSLLTFLYFQTIPGITEEARNAIESIEAAEESQKAGGSPSIQNPYLLAAGAKRMYSEIKTAGFWSAALYVAFNSILWVLSLRMFFGLKRRGYIRALATVGMISLLVVLAFGQLGITNLKSALVELDGGSSLAIIPAILGIFLLLFVTPLALSLAVNRPKELLKKWLRILGLHPLKSLWIFLLAAVFFMLAFVVFVLTAEWNIIVHLAAAGLLVGAAAFSRLFFIASVNIMKKDI